MKLHFYISNEDDAERCRQALSSAQPIAVGGTDTLTGRPKSYSGTIIAMQPAYTESPGERWRVTVDTAPAGSAPAQYTDHSPGVANSSR